MPERRAAGPQVHHALKEATAAAHRQLEEDMDIDRKVRSRAAYRRLLEGFLAAHRGIERWLDAAPLGAGVERWELPLRRKSGSLRRDLLALGCSDAQLAGLRPAALPAGGWGRAEALGCLYVCEGATLGGAVLSRHFADRLGVGPLASAGGAFFAGYGQDTGRMWRRWLAVLAAELSSPASLQAACRAAVVTFGYFGQAVVPRLAAGGRGGGRGRP